MVSTTDKRLRELINVVNMSQAEFARASGINYSSLSTYLSGRRTPKTNKLELIAKRWNVDVSWLLGYDVPMRSTMTRPVKVNPDIIAEISTNKKLYEICEKLVKLSDNEKNQISALVETILNN